MARILAFRHGFRCTVLFAIDPQDGTINPNVNDSLPGVEALDTADAIVLGLRFRRYPDEIMGHFRDAYLAGKPFVAIRTSTHAFNFAAADPTSFRRYSFRNREWPGGFGRQVLGESWVTHLGTNHKEATRALPYEGAVDHPLMRGVGTIFAPSGMYTASPIGDSILLMKGQVLAGMTRDAAPSSSGKNDPMQPVAWCRLHKNSQGNTNRILCTTMGAATDFLDESLRRLVVNGVYWGLEQEVPPKANVQLIADYTPSDFSFNGFRKGVRPDDLRLTIKDVSP